MGDKISGLIFLVYAMLDSAHNDLLALFLLFFPPLYQLIRKQGGTQWGSASNAGKGKGNAKYWGIY